MKIVVCVKQVPDTETRVQHRARAAPPSPRPDVPTGSSSPYDEFAIEEALRIKEAKGGEVVLVTVGPERAQAALRTGLAMGADSAVHVKDAALDATDTLGTARALAAAIRTLGAGRPGAVRPAGRGRRQQPGPRHAGGAARPAAGDGGREDRDRRAARRRSSARSRAGARPGRRRSRPWSRRRRASTSRATRAQGDHGREEEADQGAGRGGARPRRGGARAQGCASRAWSCRRPRPPVRMIEGDPDAQAQGAGAPPPRRSEGHLRRWP